MTESEAKLIESMADDYSNVLKEAKSMGCNDIRALYNIPLKNMELIINALEKQIPKKPYIQQDNRNNDCMECPSCDSFIGYECDCRDEHYQINYCPNCGQAIDWSDEE